MGDFFIPKHRQLTLRHEGPREGIVTGELVFAGSSVYKPLTTNVVVRVSETRVHIIDNTPDGTHDVLLDLPWEAAMALAKDMKKLAISVTSGVVQVIEGDRLLIEVPWDTAALLAKAIRAQAARAEQHEKVLRVIMDQALLIRKGVPISFTNDPSVFKEAGNEAAWDRDLRRFAPGGVPTGTTFGHPGLFGIQRVSHRIGASGVPSSEKFGRIGGR